MHIEKFITKLRELKEIHKFNEYFSKHDINDKILEHLSRDSTTLADVTNDTTKTNVSNDDVDINDDDIWTPVLQSGRRIFKGHRTHITHYPFIASVLFFDKFHCAGSIIRTDIVVTAASCLQLAWNNRFFRENPAFLSVQIGSDFYEAGGETIPVLEIFFHPEYDPKTLNHNIALMRLKLHIKFSRVNKKVKRIEIDKNASPLPSNTGSILIVGWGAKDNTGNIYNPWENRLSYAELDYYPMSDCQEVYTKEYVTEKHFCAGFFTKATGACQHDVGGPGVYRGYLIGVISFGPPICGTVDAPTVFTKVGYYSDWIRKILSLPAPYIKPLTTLLIPRSTFRPVSTIKTTKRYKVDPIMPDSKPNLRRDTYLTILEDDKLFKEFLSTMFKQREMNNAGVLNEDITKEKEQLEPMLQKESPEVKSLRNKQNTKTDVEKTYENSEMVEPIRTATKILSDVEDNFDYMVLQELKQNNVNQELKNEKAIRKISITDSPILEFDRQINIDVKSYAKHKTTTIGLPLLQNKNSNSNEENSGDAIMDVINQDFSTEKSSRQTRPRKLSKLNKAQIKYSTLTTDPLIFAIEYNDDDNKLMQPKFKTNDNDFKLDVDSSISDDNKNEKTPKRGVYKVNKAKEVKSRGNVISTPDNAEYEEVISDKLVEKYDDTDNNSELDTLVKDVLNYVKEEPIKPSKTKKDNIIKKKTSKFSTAITETVHGNKYNKRLVAKTKTKLKKKYSSADKNANDDFTFENQMTLDVGIAEEKVTKSLKLNKAEAIVKSEYEDDNNKIDEPRMRGTDDDNFIIEMGEIDTTDESHDKALSNHKIKNSKESLSVEYDANTTTSSNKNINHKNQLDSLVKDILDYAGGGLDDQHIISKKVTGVKKLKNRVTTATTRSFKKVNHENYNAKNFVTEAKKAKNKFDTSKLEDKTKSPTVKESVSDSVEYENDNSEIVKSKMKVIKIPSKLNNKYGNDKNINDYAILETDSSKEDFNKEKVFKPLSTTGDSNLRRGKTATSKHSKKVKNVVKQKPKRKRKPPTDSTIMPDITEYESGDDEILRSNEKPNKKPTNPKTDIDDETNNDMNIEEDDSVLEKDITELLDELDLQKILESTENKMQEKGSKKTKKKGKAAKVKVDSEPKSSESFGDET